jgi:hypothetical protein
MNCKICSSPTSATVVAKVMSRHDVQYFRCPSCGFVQTEEPYWLAEAYTDAIARSDIGLLERNLRLAVVAGAVIGAFFKPEGEFLDYAGGYGLFVRLMRDRGFDFYRYERQCPNIFAEGFDAGPEAAGPYEILTAFEVFEHLVNPLEDIERMLGFSRNVLFSTILVPPSAPNPGEWWYYALEHGQHVSLYTLEALTRIARRFGLNLCSDGTSLHLLTAKRISIRLFRLVSRYHVARRLGWLWRRKSLLPDDYTRLTGKFSG